MFTSLRIRIAKALAPELQLEADQRIARAVAAVDPWDTVLRDFNGVFSEEFERVEDNLDGKAQFGMEQWGWLQKKDPHFNYLVEWIMNSNANQALKRGKLDGVNGIYCRALLASMVLFRKEVGRLASKYEDRLSRDNEGNFSSTNTVE